MDAYEANIKFACDVKKLLQCIGPEKKGWKKQRSETSLVSSKRGAAFHVRAKDAVALRASLDSIAKLLIVYEKINKLTK